MSPSILKKMIQQATAARKNSHSPYSGCKVGAAIRTSKGKIYSGCNVENASFGGTVCAERGAIQTAVANEGKIQITDVVVVTDVNPPWPPCGLCRQVISEFATADTEIHAVNPKGKGYSLAFSDLLPEAFTPGHLGK